MINYYFKIPNIIKLQKKSSWNITFLQLHQQFITVSNWLTLTFI